MSALGSGERSAPRSDHFNPEERAPSTHLTGRYVGHTVGPDAERNIPAGNRTPAVHPIASHFKERGTTAPRHKLGRYIHGL
jgi:hypothetical protein